MMQKMLVGIFKVITKDRQKAKSPATPLEMLVDIRLCEK